MPAQFDKGSQATSTFAYRDFKGPCYDAGRGTFDISNDNPVPQGPMTYARATAWSVNTAFTELAKQVGLCNIVDTMVKLGLDRSSLQITPAGIILGVGLASPIQIASAYATAASGGKYCPPRPVSSITDGNGKKINLPGIACQQVMTKEVAAETTQIFQAVLNPNDKLATAYQDGLAGGRPAAGKTGTVTGAKNIWFVGYTPQLATAVWVGHGSGDQPDLKNITLAGHTYGSSSTGGFVFASDLPAPIWKSIMDAALKGQPIQQFPTVAGDTSSSSSSPSSPSSASQVAVPSVVGSSINAAIATLHAAGFPVLLGPARKGPQPKGQITAMSATGNATSGTLIYIYPSSG